MRALIVYDSQFGNTERVARAIEEGVAPSGEVKLASVKEVSLSDLDLVDLLVVGSPVQGGKATLAVQEFLNQIPPDGLRNVMVAAFDTRLKNALVKLFGYAAGPILDVLKNRGGRPVAAPEGFVVRGRKGPLAEGELERASAWAKAVVEAKVG
jgi:flavodoxin I